MDMPDDFISEQAFDTWINFFFHIIAYDLPGELKIKTDDESVIEAYNKSVYWKTKISCFNIIFILFRK